jgi:hypothetical protein
MLESALAALQSLADPGLLLMLLIGVAAGVIMGLIPGLGGTGAVAILLPVTFGMDAPQALALLIGARQPSLIESGILGDGVVGYELAADRVQDGVRVAVVFQIDEHRPLRAVGAHQPAG